MLSSLNETSSREDEDAGGLSRKQKNRLSMRVSELKAVFESRGSDTEIGKSTSKPASAASTLRKGSAVQQGAFFTQPTAFDHRRESYIEVSELPSSSSSSSLYDRQLENMTLKEVAEVGEERSGSMVSVVKRGSLAAVARDTENTTPMPVEEERTASPVPMASNIEPSSPLLQRNHLGRSIDDLAVAKEHDSSDEEGGEGQSEAEDSESAPSHLPSGDATESGCEDDGSEELPKRVLKLSIHETRGHSADDEVRDRLDTEKSLSSFPAGIPHTGASILRKRVGRGSVPTVIKVNSMIEYLGLTDYLLKIRNGKYYRRKFTIPEEQSCIRWESEKKRGTESKIMVSQMVDLLIGQHTPAFQGLPNVEMARDWSFSLVYRELGKTDAEGKPVTSTLDVIAESEACFQQWTSMLNIMILRAKMQLEYMKKGALMTKCRPKAQYQRRYFLSSDFKSITWESSKKKKEASQVDDDENEAAEATRCIELSTVRFIRIGQVTSAFRKAKNVAQYEALSFSLIYGEDFETLDLIAHKQEDFENWVSGLQSLIIGVGDSQVIMNKGTTMHKVYSKTGKVSKRKFYLSTDLSYIYWKPSKNNEKILVKDIKEMRKGHKTATFQQRSAEYDEKLCLSLIHGNQYKTLNLFIPDKADFVDWVTGLEDLLYDIQEPPRKVHSLTSSQLCAMFTNYAKQKRKDRLGFKDVCNILFAHDQNLATKSNMTRIEAFINSMGKGAIDEDQFTALYGELCLRPEMGDIMAKFGTVDPDDKNNVTMSESQLQTFLVEVQKVPAARATLPICRMLIKENEKKSEPKVSKITRKGSLARIMEGEDRPEVVEEEDPTLPLKFSKHGFTSFMMSEQGDAFEPTHDGIYQDMSLPLQNYFISSSHNTYLTADQLKGPSSVEAYIRCLRRGCRCLEIDCWDGPNGEPVVYHGHTLTSKISFRDVILAIREYAFRDSPYPLILSLENHCSLPQQKFMAAWMKSVFGEHLIETPPESFHQLPSPEDLKHKILIKCHKPMGFRQHRVIVAYDDEGHEDFGEPVVKRLSLGSMSDIEEIDVEAADEIDMLDDAGGGAADDGHDGTDASKKDKIRLHKDFADLVIYTASVPVFQGFDNALRVNQCWTMTSFGEKRLEDISLDRIHSQAMIEMSKRQNCRVFPAGARVDSSNYNPQNMWNVGCQMVALNYQTDGIPMQVNDGRFRENGNCGYLLKPTFLRDLEVDFHPHVFPGTPVRGATMCHLTISIISAQNLPRARIINPFVVLEVSGIPVDNACQKSSIQSGEGMAPVWNEEFAFQVNVSELALLRLTVKSHRGKALAPGFVGEATLPLESVREGYRHVRLNNYNGEPLSATLFVYVRKERGLQRSNDWFAKHPRPPLYLMKDKRMAVPKLQPVGIKSIDNHLWDMQSAVKKAVVLREKILALRDKEEALAESTRERRGSMALRAIASKLQGHRRDAEDLFKEAEFSRDKFLLFTKFMREQSEGETLLAILNLQAPPRPTNEKIRIHFNALSTTLRDFVRLMESTLDIAQDLVKGKPISGKRDAIMF